jgi:hypothetical protein
MLYPSIILEAIKNIRTQTNAPIYLYTAMTTSAVDLLFLLLTKLDGLTVTLHEQYDVEPFEEFDKILSRFNVEDKSLRLNVFDNVVTKDYPGWIIKRGIKWIKNAPLPDGETLCVYTKTLTV